MLRKRNAPMPFDVIGEDLAKVIDVKRRLIEAGVQSGNLAPALEILEGVRNFLRCLREDLATHLRDGTLEDMTPASAAGDLQGPDP